ncbi:hypothetical protein [Flammeovirga sp. EKP202]|uniref:hypothetical protein n=1 Tax=Flammeovirga sp. EKP202 TaxID=2770592 RepID=UPI00165EFF4F|nr:hypothetical protein [Flammeovirga sp. EKP202]MBD0402977.1 hypothetical protein [Flammeovirga sp. EKP202]
MKFTLLFLITSIILGCNSQQHTNKKEVDQNSFIKKEKNTIHTGETKMFPLKKIEFNPRYTWEENINGVWYDAFGGSPDKILKLIEFPTEFLDKNGVLAIIEDQGEVKYYSFLGGEDEIFILDEINTSNQSVLTTYGKSAYSSIKVYDFSYLEESNEIKASYEIFGMTEPEDGDGVIPFQKIQHDILIINPSGVIEQGAARTQKFNADNGVVMNEDSALDIYQFLYQKYYSALSNELNANKMELLLSDIKVLTRDKGVVDNIFRPVNKIKKDHYVNDLGLLEYDCYFIPYKNNFKLRDLIYSDYPVFYVEDHGEYVYKITNMNVEEDLISISLKQSYYINEHSGEIEEVDDNFPLINLQFINKKWVLSFQSNPLMMEKDRKGLDVINSNEGQ